MDGACAIEARRRPRAFSPLALDLPSSCSLFFYLGRLLAGVERGARQGRADGAQNGGGNGVAAQDRGGHESGAGEHGGGLVGRRKGDEPKNESQFFFFFFFFRSEAIRPRTGWPVRAPLYLSLSLSHTHTHACAVPGSLNATTMETQLTYDNRVRLK